MSHKLSEAADRDLAHIYEEGVRLFGRAQAQRYLNKLDELLERIAEFPALAPRRSQIDPEVRACPFHSHLVFYVLEGDDILVVRVRHGREDWEGD